MMKTLSLVALLAGLGAVAGCSTDPNATADLEDQRAPLAGRSSNNLNSPTTGPSSEGLPGGTNTDSSPELDPNRGRKIY